MDRLEELINIYDRIDIYKYKGNIVIDIYTPLGDLIDTGVITDPQLKQKFLDYFDLVNSAFVEFTKYGVINYYTWIENIFSPEPSLESLECNREINDFEIIYIGWDKMIFLSKEKLVTCLINREANYIVFKLYDKFKSYRFEQIAGIWVNYYWYKSDNYFFLLRIWENCSFTSELFIYKI